MYLYHVVWYFVRMSPSPGKGKIVLFAADALPGGAHSDLSTASQHKKMVSGVLQLKKQSAGHKGNPSAYNIGKQKLAFPKKVKPNG